MISYLGSLVQFSPAAGRAGRCRQMSLCVGSTRCVLARQPEVLAASPRVRRAFSLHGERPGEPKAWHTLPRCGAPFSSVGPAPHCRSGLWKSLDRNRGLFYGWEGVASLGLSLPLSPPPCLRPPAGMGRLSSGVFQSPCFSNPRRCVPAS